MGIHNLLKVGVVMGVEEVEFGDRKCTEEVYIYYNQHKVRHFRISLGIVHLYRTAFETFHLRCKEQILLSEHFSKCTFSPLVIESSNRN